MTSPRAAVTLEIDTERFTLRPVRASDAGHFTMHASDLRVAQMTQSFPHPFPPGAAETYLAGAADPERSRDIWTLDATRQGGAEFMGMVMLDRLDRNQSEISFWIPPAFWNQGIATEAVASMIDANPHAAARLFAQCFQDNLRSARVLTNNGFEFLGDAETYSVARAAIVPTWTYSRKVM